LAETESVITHQDIVRPSRRAPTAVAAAIVMLTTVFLVAIIIPRLSQNPLASHLGLNPLERENVELVALWRTGMDVAESGAETETEGSSDETDEELLDSTQDAGLPSWLLAGVSLQINERMEKLPSNQKDN
jgi:hypothetical protein